MNTSFRPRSKSGSFLSRLLYTGLSIWMLGAVYTPALAAVKVDQAPLIIQRSLPPNVTLMLDDSGSMAWDVMPDWDYLTSRSADALVSSDNNGVYFNPAITYTPPPYAGSGNYPAATFSSAWVNGFSQGTTVNLTTYSGDSDSSRNGYSNSSLGYTNSFSYTQVTSSVDPICPASTTGGTATTITGPSGGACSASWSSSNSSSGSNYYGDHCSKKRNGNNQTCTQTYPACASGASYNSANGKCEVSNTGTKGFFTFTVASSTPVTSSTTYTRHYVAANTGDCALVGLSTAKAADGYPTCDESASTRQNVANWYSYYHTRILMAKSGLMNSFSTLDTTFRVGFGSLDGGGDCGRNCGGNGNYANLPSARYSYDDSYNGGTNYIAQVQPFGDGSDSTSQKSQFWNWVAKAQASGGTPLRQALGAVGQYYSDSGKQPWNGMSSDPDFTTAAASTQLSCRQSYTILTTDGFWNDSVSGIGDVDGTKGTAVTGPNSQSYTYSAVAPYTDSSSSPASYSANQSNSTNCRTAYRTATGTSGSNDGYQASYYNSTTKVCTFSYTKTSGSSNSDTLADVAMKYWMTDLQSGMTNEVPTNADDPAFWQHMTTFTLGLGFTPQDASGTKIPVDQVFAWANGDSSKAISNFSWPTPSNANGGSINNIADLAHAAVNGHGGFFSAKDPDSFAQGIKEALKRASERVGTGASLAANSTQLQTGTVAYQANYWTAKWKGDLKALGVNSTTGVIDTNPTWTASNKLPAIDSRNIKTYNPSATAGSQFVDFKVASDGTLPSLSTAQHAALSKIGTTATNETDLINYLRGDSAKEQSNKGSYRNRDIVIGDIVNSQPVYAGAPNANQFYTEAFTGSTTFSQFASDKAGRAGAIYVASNDGMLHGFDAATGAENFAYLPGAVITAGVSALASVDYGGTVAHGFFNDGELTISDVYIGSTPGWKTVLVGTTGRGVAKTVYALDITDPASVKFLWERSAGDGNTADGNSGYIGQMTGKPVIAQTANGTWSVLIGNGYNSAQGKSALLQFDLATGTLHVHATTDTSGLAAPAVWMDPSGNGVSTLAYAGDANGHVWSFALNTSTGTDATATPDSAGVNLFTAQDKDGNAQPITAGMLAGKDPATGNTWVFFGTGQYLTTTDLANLNTQSWYGLIVQSGTSGLAVTSASTRTANLVKRSITAEVGNGRTVTTLAQAAADSVAITGKSGWYIDLLSPTGTAGAAVQQGERMVTPNQFQGNLLLGTTRIPKATDPCNPSGSGWIMALDPFTGTNPAANFFDRNADGKIDSSDSVSGTPAAGIGFSSLPNNPIFVGSTMLTSFDNGSTSSIKTSSSTGNIQRVSWRELITQ